MKTPHYRAAYAQSNHGVTTCSHEHSSVHEAAACISAADGYVVAAEYVGVEETTLHSLTDAEKEKYKQVHSLTDTEEKEYQEYRAAMHGKLPKEAAFSQLLGAVRRLVESAYSSSAEKKPGNS